MAAPRNLVPRVFSLYNMAEIGEDPGTCTQRTKTVDDWCILLRVHTCALIGLSLPKQKWWLPGFIMETESRVRGLKSGNDAGLVLFKTLLYC